MKFLLGEKFKMSQIFDSEGNVTPVTLIKVSPNIVLQIKNKGKDGYEAVQVGFGQRKAKNIKKAIIEAQRRYLGYTKPGIDK